MEETEKKKRPNFTKYYKNKLKRTIDQTILAVDLNARIGNQPIPKIIGTYLWRTAGQRKWICIKEIPDLQWHDDHKHFFNDRGLHNNQR